MIDPAMRWSIDMNIFELIDAYVALLVRCTTMQPSSCPVPEKIKHGECDIVATLIIKIIFWLRHRIVIGSNNSSSCSSNSSSGRSIVAEQKIETS